MNVSCSDLQNPCLPRPGGQSTDTLWLSSTRLILQDTDEAVRTSICLPLLIPTTGTSRLTKPLSGPRNFCKEPGPRGTFTFCSSSKVSWQHSQNPLFFFGTVTGVDRGLFSPSLRVGQPSTPLQGNSTHLPCPHSTNRLREGQGGSTAFELQPFNPEPGSLHPHPVHK